MTTLKKKGGGYSKTLLVAFAWMGGVGRHRYNDILKQGWLCVQPPCCLSLILKLETSGGVIVNTFTPPLLLLVGEA